MPIIYSENKKTGLSGIADALAAVLEAMEEKRKRKKHEKKEEEAAAWQEEVKGRQRQAWQFEDDERKRVEDERRGHEADIAGLQDLMSDLGDDDPNADKQSLYDSGFVGPVQTGDAQKSYRKKRGTAMDMLAKVRGDKLDKSDLDYFDTRFKTDEEKAEEDADALAKTREKARLDRELKEEGWAHDEKIARINAGKGGASNKNLDDVGRLITTKSARLDSAQKELDALEDRKGKLVAAGNASAGNALNQRILIARTKRDNLEKEVQHYEGLLGGYGIPPYKESPKAEGAHATKEEPKKPEAPTTPKTDVPLDRAGLKRMIPKEQPYVERQGRTKPSEAEMAGRRGGEKIASEIKKIPGAVKEGLGQAWDNTGISKTAGYAAEGYSEQAFLNWLKAENRARAQAGEPPLSPSEGRKAYENRTQE